ncbi:MAG: Holliday junction resolvase RuvX [Chloroflexota bacterium]|nr:Holliday junction resolvase RuvX [Chloroflexota bacterium]
MGLDPGGRRIGIALSDPTGLLASAHSVLRRTTPERDLAELRRIAQAHDVERVVVGLPLHMSGQEGDEAERARTFAAEVEAALGLPVDLVDERLSSIEAQRQLIDAGVRRGRVKERLDAVAAALVLQSYLESRRFRQQMENPSGQP